VSILCIVPTALRASRVARRLCDAQGGALFGRQVTTFDALAAALVAASGDRRPILAPLAERLLAVEAGREAGGPFASLTAADGLAASLGAALAELRRGEVRSAEAAAAARSLEGAPRARLELLAAALGAYERRLEELGLLDRPGALRAAALAAKRRVELPETGELSLLLLDGFTSLAPAEWELFERLASQSASVRVHLPHLADLPAAGAATEPLLRRVESLHELAAARRVDVVLDRTDDASRAPRVAAVLGAMAAIGGPLAVPPPGAGLVRGLAAAGEEAEARAIAAAAAGLVEEGFAPGDLRLFSGSPAADGARLARAFADVGIPLATGRGAPLRDLPVVRLLREALGAAGGLGRRSAERLAASGYLALGEPVGQLPVLLDRAGALDGRVAPAAALRRRAAGLGSDGGRERGRLGRAASRLESLRALLAPLEEPATGRRHAARLAGFIDASGIRRRAARGAPPLAARDLAALASVSEGAEEVSRALAHLGRAEAVLSRAEWLALLDAALSGASLPAVGEPFGGAVELLGLDESPGESARAALLVGCGRATFPTAPPPEPVLREPERQAICIQLRRQAVATAGARSAEARHRALCAVAAGREAVIFAWREGDGPVSPMVATGLAAAGVAVPTSVGPAPALADARSVREALRAGVRAAASGDLPPLPAVHGLLGEPLAGRLESALARGRIEAARRAAVDAREAAPEAGGIAPAEIAPALPAEWTASQLEEYARCPYRLFLRMGVRLPPREGAGVDIDLRDEGNLLHAALERFVAARVGRGAWPPTGDEPDRAEALAVADALFASFEAAGRTGDPAVWAAKGRAVRARLLRWVEAEARDADGLVPRLLEHRFGGDSGRPPLRFGAGVGEVRVQGRIDRVDADGRRLRVLDYKNSRDGKDRRAALDPAAFGVTSFQLPIYVAAAARELPGREELGATLALLREGERLEPFVATAAELADGPLAGQLEAGVTGTVARARAGRFPVVSRSCEHCDFGAVCRFQGVAEIEEGDERRG
jgi:RecB family exonuclease